MRAFVPAALLATFAAWCGTFAGGTGALAASVGTLLLLAVAVSAGAAWRDPLGLGWAGNWGLLALCVVVAASAAASPVPRAGLGALLVPACVLLPAALARGWQTEAARRRGLGGLALVVAVVAAWALWERWFTGVARAASPLGHHNLLATWLVTSLPLAALPVRGQGWPRIAAVVAAVLGTAAVVATGSLAGGSAFALLATAGVYALGGGNRVRRGLRAAAVLGLLAAALAAPRLSAIAAGSDASSRARAVYASAGWRGLERHVWLGMGPGSTPWTVGFFLSPQPGVNEAGELVGDLHALPLQLAYEIGVPGALLAYGLVAAWLVRPWGQGARDRPMQIAARLGVAGFLVATLGSAPLAITALPVALVVVMAAERAGGPPQPAAAGRGLGAAWVPAAYACVAALALAPSRLAHHRYEAAARAGEAREATLGAALRLDAAFPLYHARQALQRGDADAAAAAARLGPGIGAFHLLAGVLAFEAAPDAAEAALRRACALDPFAAAPPFLLLLAAPDGPMAAAWGSRALLADPRLAAAPVWRQQPGLLPAVRERLALEVGVEAGWRQAMLEVLDRVAALPAPPAAAADGPQLVVGFDGDAALGLSPFLFRRRPWPAELVKLDLDPRALAAVFDGGEPPPPAWRLAASSPRLLAAGGCRETPEP